MHCLGLPIHSILGAVIGIVGHHVKFFSDFKLIDIRPDDRAEILRDELIRTAIFPYERCLPCQEIRDPALLKSRPLKLITGAGCVVACRHVFPFVYILSPVIEEPCLVQCVSGAKFLLQVFDKMREHIGVGSAIRTGFVINLPSDDGSVITIMRDEICDQPLGIEPVIRVISVHVLSHAITNIRTARRARQNFRVCPCHPRRDRIGWCSHDDLYSCFAHRPHHAIHPGILELSVLRFPQAPG